MSIFNNKLIDFLQTSPTPFHAVKNMLYMFNQAGFVPLDEKKYWQLKPKTGYYVTKNKSSIIAFITGAEEFETQGFRMVGAHTDSPCLKIKPIPEIKKNNSFQLGVEVYGGVLLAPWFDRDLSIAGRVSWFDSEGPRSVLIDFKRPIAFIPSLAIHLDSTQNKNKTINAQTEMSPLLTVLSSNQNNFDQCSLNHMILEELKNLGVNVSVKTKFDFELCLYDTNPAAIIGLNKDFIASARLDNLLSCFVGTQSLIDSKTTSYPSLLVCNDHEEVGSVSHVGAQGPFLKQVLQRICGNEESFIRALNSSCLISADNAHALHPNFTEKHDPLHVPFINQGPVIKVNANQKYATNSQSNSLFRYLCNAENVPVQTFVSRSDVGCGSTIGPITAAELGVTTVDVGLPTYGMHSIRELAGTHDSSMLAKVLERYYKTPLNNL